MKTIHAITLTFGIGALTYCGWYGYHSWHRAKQIGTVARLQAISGLLSRLDKDNDRVTALEVAESVSKIGGGEDSWGNEIFSMVNGNGSWVVVSGGKDGKLDLPLLADYFFALPREVHGEYNSDIFYRDGRPVWSAGK